MKRITAFFLTLALVLGLCACAKAPTWQEQYDLGVKYLTDGNYEEAIIAFTAAIEIDPKRPEAYLSLADAYEGAGDFDKAREALEQGLEATGDGAIRDRLDGADGEEAPPASGEESYDFQPQVTTDGVDVDAQYLTVRVRDSRSATITVSGISVKDSYVTNMSDSGQDDGEYTWEVRMFGGETAYSVSTSSWAFEPGLNEQKALADMQHSVWVGDGTRFDNIGSAEMSYTADSITWTFTVPEEYPFDFAQVDRYEVKITNKADDTYLSRTYEVK